MKVTTAIALLAMSLILPACTHSIAVNSHPPGATVQLVEMGGDKVVKMGQTPAKKDVVGAGEYMLTLTKAGYSDYRKKIILGDSPTYDVNLVPLYQFSIDTEPAGAKLVLEDKGSGNTYSMGISPANFAVEGKGPFSVTASMPGYETVTVPVETKEGASNVYKSITMKQSGAGGGLPGVPAAPSE
jgi:hypothetical protein